MSATKIHAKDELILFTHGAYEDYQIQGLYRARTSVDLASLAKDYQRSAKLYSKLPCMFGFIEYMEKLNLVENVAYDEIHAMEWKAEDFADDIAEECKIEPQAGEWAPVPFVTKEK